MSAAVVEYSDPDWGFYLVCSQCEPRPQDRQTFNFQQCVHIIDFINAGGDAELSSQCFYALRACHGAQRKVTELPFVGWTRIATDEEKIGDYLPYKLIHVRSTGFTFKADLGLLGPGEGRLVASRSIMDFIMSQCHADERWNKAELKTRCPSNLHGVPQQRLLDAQDWSSLEMKMMMLTAIILEGACIFCLIEAHTDDNWGLGGEDFGKPDAKTQQLLGGMNDA